ncbi:MAG: SDR family NAD(P)-dependent oxidoreductase [Patescibacteria group bacterium]|nr:SDR family NAD(P)-dependent oxidoreductase [Patescibacteria group bacterium]
MQNIVIVGASSGLGLELSKQLKRFNLFLLSRNINKSNIAGKNIKKIPCNLTSLTSIKKAIDRINKPVDTFINCVGIELGKTLEHSTDKEIINVINTNLLGAIFISKYIYKKMLPNKKGFIINVSSTSGKKARSNETIYCASKFGLAGFTESLRLEARENNIRVSTIYPGGMKTDFWKNNSKDTSNYMNPKNVAKHIVDLINSDSNTCPSELIIERV